MVTMYRTAITLKSLPRHTCKCNRNQRGLRTSSIRPAVQNFSMPAMSPTMTEGNITSWKVKEGDSYSTGDVLLEIETDKAQMDVEAQEDGMLAKIIQQAGAKGVKVGSRIAFTAEEGDDLSSLELPTEESVPSKPSGQESKPGPADSNPEESQRKPSKTDSLPSPSSANPQKQRYPLYPSIAQLLHEKGLPTSEADKIPASGPKGRLLKGDVLAYLGSIQPSYSSEQSARITKLGHLDLSNVKRAPPKEAASEETKQPGKEAPPPEPAPEVDTEIAVPISLASVLSVQKRIQETLGPSLPLSTFIARATELANEDLPRPPGSKPTADELFNDVLGLNMVQDSAKGRGHFVPQITALPPASLTDPIRRQLRQPDIYDILTGSKAARPVREVPAVFPKSTSTDTVSATNVFSVSVAKGEEKRGRTFLERVKTILQVDPGRLIL